MAPILCPHCGTANRAGSYFCNRCGASLRAEGMPAPRREETPPAPADQPPPGFTQSGGEPSAKQPAAPEPPAAQPTATQSNAPEPATEPAAQPWLQPDEDTIEADVDADVADTTEVPAAAGRLVSGVQGLLEPIRYATLPGEGREAEPAPAVTAATLGALPGGGVLDADRLRRVRALMAEEPVLSAGEPPTVVPGSPGGRRGPSLWIPWVFLLIGLAIAVPVFLQLDRPTGTARQWPGVQAAYAAIEQLPPQARVQVFWAYDPATAGELDLLAAPVVQHLLDRGAQMSVVSLLPNGPATARRLFATVHDERRRQKAGVVDAPVVDARFLPGGVTVLPVAALEHADLAVVFAAQADDVQAWIEQVAARTGVRVVAVTGAGADPALRPYLDSGQLVGLVSGFDGAAAFTALGTELPTQRREQQMQVQLVAQNVALLAFLVLIVAGNLAGFFGGRRSDD